jgi:1,4-alpha-glucan branching enzyme
MRSVGLALLCALVAIVSCKTPDPKGGGASAAGAESEARPFTYEAERILDLAPTKQCSAFTSQTGIRVTRREGGRAVEGVIRVLVGRPGADIYVVSELNGWGARKAPEDKLHPVAGTPYYEGKLRQLTHGMEYRLLVDGEERLDPAAAAFTHAPAVLNSVFWDFEREAAFRMQARPVDLRRKPLVLAEAEVYELARKYPRRDGGAGPAALAGTYAFVAQSGLVQELKDAGYNGIELLPLNASIDGGKWQDRYHVFGLFAPDSRYGTPDEFARMVDAFNGAGIAVIMGAVVGHYPTRANAAPRELAPIGLHRWTKADGRSLYGDVPSSWGTRLYDYTNPDVRRFLSDSVIHMMCRYGLSGVRLDNVDGIRLYKSSGGGRGSGREFLRSLVRELRDYKPEAVLIGEMYASHNPALRSLSENGLGLNFRTHSDLFDFFKDNLLKQSAKVDLERLRSVFRSAWETNEASRVQYVTNHEAAARRRDGATGQYIASLLFADGPYYVEKKTMAFGSVAMLSGAAYLDMPQMRLLQEGNFDENPAVDWALMRRDRQKRVYSYFAELSKLFARESAFAFQHLGATIENHVDSSEGYRVVSFERSDGQRTWLAIVNLGHVGINHYQVGTDAQGTYRLAIDSDSRRFGGSGELENRLGTGILVADGVALHGKQVSLSVPYLAPYATVLIYRD